MISISLFDNNYPVKTFISVQDDLSRTGWEDEKARNAILAGYVGVDLKRVVYGEQTHSANVLAVTDNPQERRLEHVDESFTVKWKGGYDSMVTSLPGVMLCVSTADCLPVFLYDTVHNAIGIAHSGWRGTCGGIAVSTIDVMKRLYGTDTGKLAAAFGPSICGDCYEVMEDVLVHFRGRYSPEEMKLIARKKGGDKYLLDNKAAVRLDLINAGINPDNIYDAGICSYESPDFASYRRDGRVEHYEQTLSGIVLV
jgi:YfiH family protein